MPPSERFADALNAQIGREYAAAHQYTAIAAWYDAETFPRLSKFFYDQAEEERDNASEIFLQWFVSEQVEEEDSIASLLHVAERVRDFPMMVEEFLARDGKSLG